MIGPLTQLRWKGTACPCLLSTEESVAKSSEEILATVLDNVRWHQNKHTRNYSQKERHPGNVADTQQEEEEDDDEDTVEEEHDLEQSKNRGAFGFIANITSKVSAAASSSISRNRTMIVNASCQFVDVGGLLSILLGGAGGGGGDSNKKKVTVALEVNMTQNQRNSRKKQSTKNFNPVKKIRIPLRKIVLIRPCSSSSTCIAIEGKPKEYDSSGTREELLRLEIPSLLKDDTNVMDGTTREEFIEHFQNILDWDRIRREAEGNAEEYDSDDDHQRGGIRNRAQKAAHFAKREIEMQTKRREREQRKAKYLKDAGGLKYTALAMANRNG